MNGRLIKTTEYRHVVSSTANLRRKLQWQKSQLNIAVTTKATTAKR